MSAADVARETLKCLREREQQARYEVGDAVYEALIADAEELLRLFRDRPDVTYDEVWPARQLARQLEEARHSG